MSSEELARLRSAQPISETKSLDAGIASDVAHIASLLGPEDCEPPAALSPRPVGIREDVRVLAVTLFESAKAETVRASMKPRTLRPEAVFDRRQWPVRSLHKEQD